jgi:hypothetical protein
MAPVLCGECCAEFEEDAIACDHCGVRNPRYQESRLEFASIVAVALLAALVLLALRLL